ncbi:F-box family protein isoform X2 [Wolffia australiana]
MRAQDQGRSKCFSIHPPLGRSRCRNSFKKRKARSATPGRVLEFDFSDLPDELLLRIAAPMDLPTLLAASAVCKSWREALRPMREAMVLLCYGKRFKHGRGGWKRDPQKALESFLKGAARGLAAAMVDAGLMYWEMGRKEESRGLYWKAAELGHPTAQCNLGISFLEADHPNPVEAVKWFRKSAMSGYARAQYSLALCLHRGRGVEQNPKEAAKWFLQAAEGGNIRAMYNVSICYSTGEGLPQDHRQARKWMKLAADQGHKSAQLERGLELYASGDLMKALVYLELATRAGESSAAHVKEIIEESLCPSLRNRAMSLVDKWQMQHTHHQEFLNTDIFMEIEENYSDCIFHSFSLNGEL